MDIQKSLQVLIQAAQIGQTKGAYSLTEAKIIAEAIEVFQKKPEAKKEDTTPNTKKK